MRLRDKMTELADGSFDYSDPRKALKVAKGRRFGRAAIATTAALAILAAVPFAVQRIGGDGTTGANPAVSGSAEPEFDAILERGVELSDDRTLYMANGEEQYFEGLGERLTVDRVPAGRLVRSATAMYLFTEDGGFFPGPEDVAEWSIAVSVGGTRVAWLDHELSSLHVADITETGFNETASSPADDATMITGWAGEDRLLVATESLRWALWEVDQGDFTPDWKDDGGLLGGFSDDQALTTDAEKPGSGTFCLIHVDIATAARSEKNCELGDYPALVSPTGAYVFTNLNKSYSSGIAHSSVAGPDAMVTDCGVSAAQGIWLDEETVVLKEATNGEDARVIECGLDGHVEDIGMIPSDVLLVQPHVYDS